MYMHLICKHTNIQAAKHFDDFKKRVHKIAYTDSVHDMDMQQTPRDVKKWMLEVC